MEDINNKEQKENQYPTIEEQKKHFKSFSSLPTIIGLIIFAVSFLVGILTAVSYKSTVLFFVSVACGAVVGAITLAILRILISSQILSVLYLEKISNDIEKLKTASENNIGDRADVGEQDIIESTDSEHEPDIQEESTKSEQEFAEQQAYEEITEHAKQLENEEKAEQAEQEERDVISIASTDEPDEQKERALTELKDLLEISDKVKFYKSFEKWNSKYGNNLLYWDLILYNKIISFINSVNIKVYLDSNGKEKTEYSISKDSFKNIKTAISEYCS